MADAPEEPVAPGDDEVHRRFREALQRKQARGLAPEAGDGGGRRTLGASQNDKRQRQFRRKSGG